MKRKEFLERCVSLTVVAACSPLLCLAPGCAQIKTIQAKVTDNRIALKRSDFDEQPQLIVRRSNARDSQLFVVRHSDGSYTAVSMLCTHKACELRPDGAVLTCPCHGSEFSLEGSVLSPPAREDLQKFRISIENDSVVIHL